MTGYQFADLVLEGWKKTGIDEIQYKGLRARIARQYALAKNEKPAATMPATPRRMAKEPNA